MSASPLENLYEWLSQVSSPDAEGILAAALHHAEPPHFDRIVEELFARATDAAWTGLIASYERLSPPIRERLVADDQHWRAGLTRALKSANAHARSNALTALSAHPCPALCYLLPDILRDTSNEVRTVAAQTLRRLAEAVLDGPVGDGGDAVQLQEHRAARAKVAEAVQQALRTFDRHYRLEAIELSLWFAQDLAESLWDSLEDRRSQSSFVVREQLSSWNSPRLARFLLEALVRPPWRQAARDLLQGWQSPAEVSALLLNSDALANREIRHRLNIIRAPRWFQDFSSQQCPVPPELRGRAAQWVCYLGFSDREKLIMLTEWLYAREPALQRGAAHALAALGVPEALPRLSWVAAQGGPLAAFARWYVAGRQAGVATPARGFRLPPAPFNELWHECRRRTAHEDAELIEALRQNLPSWQADIAAALRSADPGDRLLALRVLSSSEHVALLRSEVQALLNDPVSAIRRIARRLCVIHQPSDAPARAPTTTPHPAPPPAQPGLRVPHDPVTELASASAEMRRLAEELAAGETELDTPPTPRRPSAESLRRPSADGDREVSG